MRAKRHARSSPALLLTCFAAFPSIPKAEREGPEREIRDDFYKYPSMPWLMVLQPSCVPPVSTAYKLTKWELTAGFTSTLGTSFPRPSAWCQCEVTAGPSRWPGLSGGSPTAGCSPNSCYPSSSLLTGPQYCLLAGYPGEGNFTVYEMLSETLVSLTFMC